MKILLVHNEYQQRGGEDVVVQNERALLEAHGHAVSYYLADNRKLKGLFCNFTTALNAVFSVPTYFRARAVLKRVMPDVVHVHNFFPQISPSIFYACKSLRIPVVLTLHNYRIICPTALLMCDGRIEERSITKGPWWAVPRRVYRSSLLGTFALAAMIAMHRMLGTWQKKIDVFVTLNAFAAAKFRSWGLPESKIVSKPNFADLEMPEEQTERRGVLFAGRLSPEKGVGVLLGAARELGQEFQVRIAGDGPMQSQVNSAQACIEYLGRLGGKQLANEMLRAHALVLPSLCYEGFPMVLVEAYASGLPVIASRLGPLAELIEDGVTGLHFEPGNERDLAQKIQWILEHPNSARKMGVNARARYDQSFTPSANYAQLMEIYQKALGRNLS